MVIDFLGSKLYVSNYLMVLSLVIGKKARWLLHKSLNNFRVLSEVVKIKKKKDWRAKKMAATMTDHTPSSP